jgi:hypothetical protein
MSQLTQHKERNEEKRNGEVFVALQDERAALGVVVLPVMRQIAVVVDVGQQFTPCRGDDGARAGDRWLRSPHRSRCSDENKCLN